VAGIANPLIDCVNLLEQNVLRDLHPQSEVESARMMW